ncbi:MAG: acyltransferase [Prosthecobacter sp.]|jgi:exopolysaccharide production protein ExoZ|nr:acyltransferase [Prosthecobacter sp.]
MTTKHQTMLWTIQYLRGIAALMVAFFHANAMAQEYWGASWFEFGAAGVDIFFVISGFIMWVTVSEKTTPSVFLQNRFIRIVPLYWIITFVLFAGWFAFRQSSSIDDLAKSLFFIPFLSARTGEIQPLLVAGWTLNFEMFFYIIFATTLFFGSGTRMVILFAVLGTLALVGMLWTFSNPILRTYTSALLLEFALGCILAIIYQNDMVPRKQVGAFLIAMGVGLLLVAHTNSAADLSATRLIAWGLPSFLIVAGAVCFEPLPSARIPSLIGAASYSVYLTHGALIAALKNMFLAIVAQPGLLATSGFIAVALVASVVTGIATYFAIERPLQRFFGTLVRTRTQTKAPFVSS